MSGRQGSSTADLAHWLEREGATCQRHLDAAARLRELDRVAVQAEELRRAVAEIIGADPDTWPDHGNAPLAIAAALAVRHHASNNLRERNALLLMAKDALTAAADIHPFGSVGNARARDAARAAVAKINEEGV